MVDATAASSKMVPGFDFLQGLVKNAGAAMPGIGQWVAPTLDPEELEKRIGELRTVQFWLEQNARMLATTIQALEVQKMTLSTLKTMNVQMGDLRESLKLKPLAANPRRRPAAAAAKKAAPPRGQGRAAARGMVDPMQWWGALTSQFAQLATSAMKDSAADAAKTLAGNMLKQSFDNAAAGFKAAAAAPVKAATAAGAAALGAAAGAGKAVTRPKAGAQAQHAARARPSASGARRHFLPRQPADERRRTRRRRPRRRGAGGGRARRAARPKSSPRSARRCLRMRCSGGARTPCPTNATASPPIASSRWWSPCPRPRRRSPRCWRSATGCRCRWWRAAPAPACPAGRCRTRSA